MPICGRCSDKNAECDYTQRFRNIYHLPHGSRRPLKKEVARSSPTMSRKLECSEGGHFGKPSDDFRHCSEPLEPPMVATTPNSQDDLHESLQWPTVAIPMNLMPMFSEQAVALAYCTSALPVTDETHVEHKPRAPEAVRNHDSLSR